jgi:hypothetical protein
VYFGRERREDEEVSKEQYVRDMPAEAGDAFRKY